jgi:hypothetical protein
MNTHAKSILVVIAFSLSGGLLATNSIPATPVHGNAISPAVTPANFGNSVFALAESVDWARMENVPMWPTF